MESGTRGPLTLLSAPAGAGKTTLVGSGPPPGSMQGVAWVDNDDLTGGDQLADRLRGEPRDGDRAEDSAAPVILVVDLSDQDDLDGTAQRSTGC